MSYRKITVKGKEYQYTIGKTHTKIRGVGVFPNEKIGEKLVYEPVCECCGEPLSAIYCTDPRYVTNKFSITPAIIKRTILGYAV